MAKAGPSADGVIKAGWWFCLGCGLVLGLLATVAVATSEVKNEAGRTVGMLAISGGYYVAILLWAGGGLAHVVLCTVAMVRGSVGRAMLLLFVGPVLGVALAMGMPMAAAAVLAKQRSEPIPEKAQKSPRG